MALRPAFAISLITFITVPVLAADPRLKGTVDLVDQVQTASGFSPDGQAVTVLFRNLDAVVGGEHGTLVDTRTVTVALPIAGQDQEVPVRQFIRGYFDVQGASRAVLVVQAAGTTTLVDLKKAQQAANGQADKPAGGQSVAQARERARAAAQALPEDPKPAAAADFCQQIDGKLPAGGNYQVTFFLLVEREAATADSGALLAVDSLDVELSKPDGSPSN